MLKLASVSSSIVLNILCQDALLHILPFSHLWLYPLQLLNAAGYVRFSVLFCSFVIGLSAVKALKMVPLTLPKHDIQLF